MLKFKPKHYASYVTRRWQAMDYHYCKKHLDFNKFSYKDGPKIYTGTSKEVRDLFRKEKKQVLLWDRLKQ